MRRDTGWIFPPLPPVTHAEGIALARRAQAGDKEARDYLTVAHLGLVVKVAARFHRCAEMDDLIAVGTEGLMRAVDAVNPARHDSFTSYATAWIRLSIQAHLKHESYRKCRRLAVGMPAPSQNREILPADEQAVTDLLGTLDERQAAVIARRYGVGGQPALTQKETARELGMKTSTVAWTERCAIAKLRELVS